MNFTILSESIVSIIRDYHPEPRQWIQENQRYIQDKARADGTERFLSALELFCRQRQGKLNFFFQDYAGFRYQASGGSPGTVRTKARQMDQSIEKDMEHVAEIRAEGLTYFQGEEWQAFKRSLWTSERSEKEPNDSEKNSLGEKHGAGTEPADNERIEF